MLDSLKKGRNLVLAQLDVSCFVHASPWEVCPFVNGGGEGLDGEGVDGKGEVTGGNE